LLDRSVLITGIGLATPLGDTLQGFAHALFDEAAHQAAHAFTAVHTRHTLPVPGARVATDPAIGLTRSERQLADRSVQLALQASTRALVDAGLPVGTRGEGSALDRCGVFVGCGSGPTESLQTAYATLCESDRMAGLTLLRCLPGGAASAVAIRHALRGPAQTYSNACAASATAIGEALRAIRHGYLDMALVGGCEAPFGDTTVRAWHALRVLAPLGEDAAEACRPFDRDRRGLVLGEGAVFFVLESADAARARQARAHARLAGFGSSGDGSHVTEPNAHGQVQAMQAALDDAGLRPGQIAHVNAHGTGTTVGDQVEAESIAAVFGHQGDAPVVSATKSAHGHLLGASGAIELAAATLSLQSAKAPPTRNLRQRDTACAVQRLSAHAVPLPPGGAVLSNSFAFGGSNACLVLTAA
jgi:3-oxoacyl-[acyl-carrier-protein] synthase II